MCCRGSAEATRQAHNLITALIRDSDRDIEQIIPRLKAKAVTTNTLTMSTNVWHNSMANSVPSTAIITGATSTGSPLVSRGGGAVVATVATVVQTTQVLTTRGQMSAEMSTHMTTGAWGNATFPPLGRGSGTKPAPNGMVATGQGQVGKSGVSRQLFPLDKTAAHQQQAMLSSSAKTIAMYSSPATAKTNVVSTSAMNPAMQVDAEVVPSSGRSVSKMPGNGRHPPGVQVTKIASEPQLCGQMPPGGGVIASRSHVAVSPVSSAVTLPPGEYSPFNNAFSKVTVIGKKTEQVDNRMNFASVAASGVVAPSSDIISSGIVAPSGDSQSDESLQAKAPGYKAPGQRSASDPAQGYKGVGTQPQQPMCTTGFPYGVPAPFPTSHLPPMCSQTSLGSRVPMMPEMNGGTPGMGFGMPPLMGMMPPSSMDPGGERLSPRLDAFGFPHRERDEYSTQDRPMTLPKIDSNLNPNAPNFTSMFLQRQHREQCAAAAAAASHMVMPPGNMNMASMMPGGADMMPMPHPAFRPPMQVGAQKPFNGGVIAPPPSQLPIGNAFHQVPPSNVGSDFTAGPSLSGGFNPLIGSGPFIGASAATTQPPPKQFSPLAASSVVRSSSTPSSIGGASSKGETHFSFLGQSCHFEG